MHPKDLSIDDFTYELPQEKIALYPADPRDSSKLLVFRNGHITDDIYRHIDRHLPEETALVFNDTRVIKSRILFPKTTGAVIEIFCLEPYEHTDYDRLFEQKGSALWKCMIGKAGKWKEKKLSKSIRIGQKEVQLTAELIKKLTDAYVVRLSWDPPEVPFGKVIDAAGITPLPPYIKRKADENDETCYQTVFSEHKGSVAAPTAGLHFTGAMMQGFHDKGIQTLFTTLHVGAGTFKPVKSDTMEGHVMHSEWMYITSVFLEELLENIGKHIISVGTTAMRTLESIYWMGNKVMNQRISRVEELKVSQWEAYETKKAHQPAEALRALIDWMKKHQQDHLMIETGIIIAPGYHFKIVAGLITNFHQPKSTLLLLVSALVGDQWKRIYDYALTNKFRFLSYGDGCLLLPA